MSALAVSDAPARAAATGGVVSLLRLEGLAVLAAAASAYALIGGSWLLFALLLLAPDVAMIGYRFGPVVGAAAYNAVHAYLAPAALGAAGLALGAPAMQALALIWIAHIGLDRALGYGLKYSTGFGDTHLGSIGRGA
ncbi:MAG: DUF4260 family protein [Roseiarcus sp.]|jgi:hypothetical protein